MKGLKCRGRFYHGRNPHPFRKLLTGLVAFLGAIVLFCQGMNSLSDRADKEQKKSLEEAIWRGITQCYAIEGRYPESLEYLKEAYGVQYDSERFFVDYQVLGSNIVPDVTIIEK